MADSDRRPNYVTVYELRRSWTSVEHRVTQLEMWCPVSHLDDEAQTEWNRITPELSTLGLITRIDRAALAAYCQAWSRWVKAEEMLKSTGPVIKSKATGAIYQNPYLAVANRAMKQMRDFLTEFGMTPSSRNRVSSGLRPVGREGGEVFFGGANSVIVSGLSAVAATYRRSASQLIARGTGRSTADVASGYCDTPTSEV